MRLGRHFLAGAILLALGAVGCTSARASQGSACLPVTGVINGVAYTENINAAFAAALSTNSGSTAPANGCTGTTVAGQQWYDTTLATPAWRIYDGAQSLAAGWIDATNHLWMPVLGGGVASLSGATIDLCSVPQDVVTVTGSTTITSFGSSCQIGQFKFVNFSSVLAIAYNASAILLPTSANVTTEAGDQAIALYFGGGVWRLVAYTRADGTPLSPQSIPPIHYAGEVILMRGTTCPAGSLQEDGTALSRTTYPALYAYLGTTWGAGDGSTTFNIPNSGGEFDRGWISGQSLDPGRSFGSSQQDQFQDHQHDWGNTAQPHTVSGTGNFGAFTEGGSPGELFTTNPTSGRHGSETRPVNIPAYHCLFTGNSP